MTAEFAGKIAVITGGGSGLGAAMGATFAQVEMGVAVLDIDAPAAEATAKVVGERYVVPSTSVHVDIGDGDSIGAAAAHVERTLGGCERAIRHLVQDLRENQPYSITHGSFRTYYQQRREAIGAAFDRMEAP